MASQTGSLLSVGLMVGTLLGGSLSDWLARRWCLLLTSPLTMLGWASIVLGSAPNQLWPFYAGRVLTGFGTGAQVKKGESSYHQSNQLDKSHLPLSASRHHDLSLLPARVPRPALSTGLPRPALHLRRHGGVLRLRPPPPLAPGRGLRHRLRAPPPRLRAPDAPGRPECVGGEQKLRLLRRRQKQREQQREQRVDHS